MKGDTNLAIRDQNKLCATLIYNCRRPASKVTDDVGNDYCSVSDRFHRLLLFSPVDNISCCVNLWMGTQLKGRLNFDEASLSKCIRTK